MLTAAATAAVATAKELLAQKLKTEPSPILPNPVQIAADPSVVPEGSRQHCGGGAISTGSTISGSSGGGGDGSGRSGRSSGKEHDNSSGVLRTGADVANTAMSAESRAAPTPVTVKDVSKQPKAATLDVKAAATKSGALEAAESMPSTIAPPKVRAQPFLIEDGDGLIMAATTTEGGRGQGRDNGEAEVDAVCDVGVVVVSAQDPNEEVKAAVGEAEVRVYMEYGRLYFGCSQLYSVHAC